VSHWVAAITIKTLKLSVVDSCRSKFLLPLLLLLLLLLIILLLFNSLATNLVSGRRHWFSGSRGNNGEKWKESKASTSGVREHMERGHSNGK